MTEPDRGVGRPRGGDAVLGHAEAAQLVVVTGKGGVGKSTVSAVLARVLVRRGKRVLVLEVDPRESLHQLLDVPPSGGEITTVEGGLFLQNLPPRRVMDEVVRERVKIDALVRRVLASPIYRAFADGAPGLKELAVLGHAFRLVEGHAGARVPRVDTVILDAPATGHGMALLAAPRLAAGVIGAGPFARMARDLEALVGDERRCAVVAVTSPEEMPVQETLELMAGLPAQVGRAVTSLVINGVFPPWPGGDEDLAPPLAVWRNRSRTGAKHMDRVVKGFAGPVTEWPLLPIERGPALVAELLALSRGGLR